MNPSGNRRPRPGHIMAWLALLLAPAAPGPAPAAAPGARPLDAASQAFLKSHCLRCHDSREQKGRFRLDNLGTDFADETVAGKWSEVRFRISAGEMPPPKEPRPAAEEMGRMMDALTERLREGSATRLARRGPVEYYRLSRQEYAHTVYDLLGVVFDVQAPGAFSEDPRWHGFDRIGALLTLAPSHVQRYLEAADAVIQQAFPDTESPARTNRQAVGKGQRRLLQLGEGWKFRLPDPGHYRIRIQASGLPAFSGRAPHLSLWHTHHRRSLAGQDLVTPEQAPPVTEFEGLFPAGAYEVRNHGRTVRHPNGSIAPFRNEVIDAAQPVAALTGGHRSPWTKVVDEEGKPTSPLLLIDWIEVEGPILTTAARAARQGVFPDRGNDPGERRACLRRFAERAWRRTVAEAEIEPYDQLVEKQLAAGEPFRAAYRSALAALLMARGFLHLEQGSPEENRTHLNDFELASRLSYFLWSSLPDDTLFAAARRGELRAPGRLAREFERMVADPKIERFLGSFPQQWLQLHRVGMFQPDPKLYPDYDPWLEESMVAESTAFFAELFRRDLPLREAIDSRWTMVNSRLAAHYGLPRPHPAAFTRVNLDPASGRGGLLTHASVLSLTSDGTRHRPVHRGAWVSEAILAQTPPPPPPNVDPLEPVAADKPKASIRAQLAAHATAANCAACHARLDPLGLAFENFDAIGRRRETERVRSGLGEDPAVDATGVLPDGRRFGGPAEFKALLAQDERRLAEAFLEQLATYALRRVMTVDDREHLRRLVPSGQARPPGLRGLVRTLVTSDLFQER